VATVRWCEISRTNMIKIGAFWTTYWKK